jgi:bacterioferritin
MTAKNRQKSIEVLNAAVAGELTALLQYMYFHFHLEDLGYKPLAEMFRKIAIQEMIHVEQFAERILYLGGEVIMKPDKITALIPHDVKKMLEYADSLETDTMAQYNEAVRICAEQGDSVTKRLFEEIVTMEEGHEDIFSTEGDNLDKMGDTLLALNAIEYTKENAGGGE